MSFDETYNVKNTGFSFQRKYNNFIRKRECPSEADSTCSDSYFEGYSRQLKTLSKQLLPKPKDERNSDGADIGRKISQTRPVPPQVKGPLNYGKTYKSTVFPKQRMKMTKTANAAVAETKSTHNTDPHRCNSESALPSSETISSNCNVKQAKKCVKRCESLLDLRMAVNNHSAVSPFSRESSLLLSPSRTFKFQNNDSKSPKESIEYVREFDYTYKYGLFNFFNIDERATEIFSLAPEIEPLSQPITLKRKKYKCEILSADDSPKTEEVKSTKSESKSTVSFEYQDNSDIYSTATSDCSDSSGDFKSLDRNSGKENSLIIEKPIRVKCINEVTEQMTEIIIYTNEFLKNMLKECGDIASKQEVLKNIIRHSTDYNGKSIRILQLTDNLLKSCRKSQGNFIAESKIPTKVPPKTSSTEFLKKNIILGASRRSKSCDTTTGTGKTSGIRQERSPFLKPTAEGRQLAAKSNSVSKLSILGSMNYKITKKQQSKTETDLSNSDVVRKSRITLKRINVEEIIASDFRHYFHFYAKLGHSKCGVTISKRNSLLWLKKCGVIYDIPSEKMAERCFMNTAMSKCILNISDYIQFLILVAKNKGTFLIDLVQQLMSVQPHSVMKGKSNTKSDSALREENQMKNSSKDLEKH